MAVKDSTRPPVHSRSKNGTALYERQCTGCGATAIVEFPKVKNQCRKCAAAKRATHGLTKGGTWHPLYQLLKSMIARCEIPSATNYSYYGGRGIRVCAEWRNDPLAFVAWAQTAGWKPSLEIDRINNDWDYCSQNCRFITARENSQRTRRIKTTPEQAREVKKLLAKGESVKDAAKLAGVTYMVAWHIKNRPDAWSNV